MSAYELRSYQIAPGKMDTIQTIFRELVIPMLGDFGIESVGYWATPEGDALHYIVRHDSLNAIEGNWDRFHADPRWKPGLQAREKGETVELETKAVPLVAIPGLPAAEPRAGR